MTVVVSDTNVPASDAPTAAPALNGQTFDGLRDFIRPTPEEVRWQQRVPWRTSLWQGVQEAQATDKPLLLWAMNGHPLACTWNNGVKGRQSVWSDPEVLALLPGFVPVADEVGRLQREADPEARLFQKIAEQGHYAGQGPPRHTGTRQGTYAAAPSGVLLASVNTNDPERMAAMLRRALKVWETLPRVARLLPVDPDSVAEDAHRARAERPYPEGGLVLGVHTRDLPRAGSNGSSSNGSSSSSVGGHATASPEDWRATAWNQDFAWFTKDEARQLVPANPTAGQVHAVPDPLIRRLARLHFLDNVRGQTPAYRDDAVKTAWLTNTVIGSDGPRVSLRLEGQVRLCAEGVWPVNDRHDADNPQPNRRGFDARLLGYATWDEQQQRFLAFEMLAVGTRWGGTQYNRRHDDLAPAPLGIALTLAEGDTPAERVAPAQFGGYGWQ